MFCRVVLLVHGLTGAFAVALSYRMFCPKLEAADEPLTSFLTRGSHVDD